MKKIAALVIAVIAIVGICTMATSTYTLDGMVIANANGNITIEDMNGNLWKMTDENIEENTLVKVTFKTMHTDIIYDDEIIAIEEK